MAGGNNHGHTYYQLQISNYTELIILHQYQEIGKKTNIFNYAEKETAMCWVRKGENTGEADFSFFFFFFLGGG